MTGQRVAPELLTELEQAKRNNIGCVLHAEHRRRAVPSVWTYPAEQRRPLMRQRCGRSRWGR